MSSLGGAFTKLVDNGYMYKFKDSWDGIEYPLHITEHIACSLIRYLGYSAQDTELVKYVEEEAVRILLFDKDIIPVYNMKKETLNTDNIPERSLNSHTIELYENMITKENQYKFNFTQEDLNNYIYTIVAIDLLIGNIDRHPGNIGFLIENSRYSLAPIYDCGMSLWYKDYYTKKISSNRIAFRRQTKRLKPEEVIKYYGDRINSTLILNIGKGTNFKDSFKEVKNMFGDKYDSYLNYIELRYNINKEMLLRCIK